MPPQFNFLSYEANPTIIDNLGEAWWFNLGKWQTVEHSGAFRDGSVIGFDGFGSVFDDVPPLPPEAFGGKGPTF